MSTRTWIKIFCENWFGGSIRQESPLLRSVWVDVLALAGRTGQTGRIALPGLSVGYTDGQLASIFHLTIDQWMECKELLSCHPGGEEENRITVSDGNVIEIINWSSYQSEYSRQRSYRDKLQDKVTRESNSQRCGEKEKEKEKENRSKDQKQDRVNSRRKPARFTVPTVDQVREYCESRGNNVNPEKFHAFYTSNGWKVGKNPMKNWKAAIVSTWEKDQHAQPKPIDCIGRPL